MLRGYDNQKQSITSGIDFFGLQDPTILAALARLPNFNALAHFRYQGAVGEPLQNGSRIITPEQVLRGTTHVFNLVLATGVHLINMVQMMAEKSMSFTRLERSQQELNHELVGFWRDLYQVEGLQQVQQQVQHVPQYQIAPGIPMQQMVTSSMPSYDMQALMQQHPHMMTDAQGNPTSDMTDTMLIEGAYHQHVRT